MLRSQVKFSADKRPDIGKTIGPQSIYAVGINRKNNDGSVFSFFHNFFCFLRQGRQKSSM